MGGTRDTERALLDDLKEGYHLEDERIILKFILEKSKGMACTPFIWLQI